MEKSDLYESFKKEIFSDIRKMTTLILLIVMIYFTSKYVISFVVIPSESMYPALHQGDVTICIKINKKIYRGDILVFNEKQNGSNTEMAKRVIGLPGEKIDIVNNELYINNKLIQEVYIHEKMKTKDLSIKLPQDAYFVMGDNRNNSNDARFWEIKYIKRSQVIGKIKAVVYPFLRITLF